LLYGIKDTLRHLQSIQNVAVCLLTGARSHDHISLVLCRLHRLPAKQQVSYKLATVIYKSLQIKPCHTWWTTASWLPSLDAASFTLWTPTSSLSHEYTCNSETGVSQLWDWEYGTVCLCHWDSLILNLDNLNVYWRYYCIAKPQRISDFCFKCAMYKKFTYLLTYLLTYCWCVLHVILLSFSHIITALMKHHNPRHYYYLSVYTAGAGMVFLATESRQIVYTPCFR